MAKCTLGVIVTNRNFFADRLVAEGRTQLLSILKEMDIDVVIVDETETSLGAVESLSDSKKCADLFRKNAAKIEGILVSLPNFGNEKGVSDAIRLSGLKVPVLVHAFPDTTQELTPKGRRDAFCGKISATNVLRQYGIDYSLTQKHTLDPASAEFKTEIEKFIGTCKVVKGLTNVRLGAIGARPNAFQTVRFSEKLLDAYGINVSTADFSEIFGVARKLDDSDARVKERIEGIQNYAKSDKAPSQALLRMGKLAVAIGDWMAENEIQATALQCWDSLQKNYGVNACTLMSMMSEQLMPSACETDIMGTLSMYALSLASGRPSALMDWNNNYDDEEDKCLLFHCGNWPKDLSQGLEVISAEVLGTILGTDNTWGALQARPAAGPMTYARIDTDDTMGMIKAYVGEGQFTDDGLSRISGAHAVLEVPGLQSLLRYICREGFAHHGAMTGSYCAASVVEAFENYLGWPTYYHKG